jgi:hypothetical protein
METSNERILSEDDVKCHSGAGYDTTEEIHHTLEDDTKELIDKMSSLSLSSTSDTTDLTTSVSVSVSVTNTTNKETPSETSKELEETYDPFYDMLISNNEYLKNIKSIKERDTTSLSYLVDRQLSQSDCIKLGQALEKLLTDLVIRDPELKNIKQKNIKGVREKDILVLSEKTKTIYYAECKSNINLDTEKYKSTIDKINNIEKELLLRYPEYKIVKCLISFRYLTKTSIPKTTLNKYLKIKEHIYGLNDFLSLIGNPYIFRTEEHYKKFVNKVASCINKIASCKS